jgi:hypothetical protein
MMDEVEAEPWEVDREDFLDLEQILEEDLNLNNKTSQGEQVEECRWMLYLLAHRELHLLPINIKATIKLLQIGIISKVE